MPYAIVTGGAGFIGSHLVKRLVDEGCQVKVLDNFSCGKLENLAHCDKNEMLISKMDLRDLSVTVEELKGAEVIYHLAADPEVRISMTNPISHYENNLQVTFNVLEAMRLNKVKYLVFTSSSAVYGDAEVMPTPENYPLNPISIYGTAKAACGELIKGYIKAFGMKALILRPANIIGSHGTHGVILDFIKKLKTNPAKLEILGDGTQRKSYLHVSDCIEAIMRSYRHFRENELDLEIYNIGNHDTLTVREIAKIVTEEMELENVNFELTGGVDGGRGWKGDVKTMLLSISKLVELGWRPSLNSEEAVRRATSELLASVHLNQL